MITKYARSSLVALLVLVASTMSTPIEPAAAATQTPVPPTSGTAPVARPTPFDATAAAKAGEDAKLATAQPFPTSGAKAKPLSLKAPPSAPSPSARVAPNQTSPAQANATTNSSVAFATHTVFATRYDPIVAGSVEAAVPDKCAKFAALGQSSNLSRFGCPASYSLGLDYRVVVTRANGQSATFPVKEVGPWNEDDNYWAAPTSPRPRRLFRDLPAGMPEAQAAFQNGYNAKPNCKNLDGTTSTRTAGTDQFGRCVLNPAGIDFSTAAAAQLGLGNEYVTVTFLWEPLQPITVAMASQDDPGGASRVGVINSCRSAYVKDGSLSGPFQQQLNCGDATTLTMGGLRIGVINSCGALYVKDGNLAGPFSQQLNCGDGKAVSLSSGRRVGVVNGCGAAYVKEGDLSSPFRQQTNCGDTQVLDVAARRVAVINGCGALYVKEPGVTSNFQQQTGCGDAVAVGVSSNRVGVVNSCGSFYVKDGALTNSFQQQTSCYDTRAIAVTDGRIAVINSCGAAYVKEGALNSPFNLQLNCNDAVSIQLSSNRVAVVNSCRAAYVKEGPLTAPFQQQLNCGDANFVTVSG